MTQSDKKLLIAQIFKRKTVFEKKVLNIVSDSDRAEIMQILAKSMVRGSLKYELNFLYMEDFSKFTFKPVTNILFREIASEWIYYAMDELKLSKSQALAEIQTKDRVLFIRSLVSGYYKKYQSFIYKESADTFIELIKTIPHAKAVNKLVNEVLKSKLVVNNNVLAVHSFRQLLSRVKAAQNVKNADLSRVQIIITDLAIELENEELGEGKRKELELSLRKYERELNKIMNKTLDKFDGAVKRFKDTLVNSMANLNNL